MYLPMNLNQQLDSASALRSFLASGMPLADAAARMARLQPAYATFWKEAAASMGMGKPLSGLLVQVWPDSAVSALRAGELNGKLDEIMAQLVHAIRLQIRLRKSAKKIQYPLWIVVLSILIALFFLTTIVPSIQESLLRAAGKVEQPDGIAGMGLVLREFVLSHWIVVAVVVVACFASIMHWWRLPSTKEELTHLLLSVPKVGRSLSEMYFGLWAQYMAMSCRAGIPTIASLESTAVILPAPLRPGVQLLANDMGVRNIPMSQAADPDLQSENDPRRHWPLYVSFAFIVGESTGDLDAELRRVAPEMIERGEEGLQRAVALANYVAIGVAAAMAGGLGLLLYLPMLQQLQTLR